VVGQIIAEFLKEYLKRKFLAKASKNKVCKKNFNFLIYKSMSISYKIVPRKNPQDLTVASRYYAAVTPNGSVGFESLAEIISEQCTVTDTDCLAVLNVLEKNIIRELKEGRIVRLGKLGNFQVGLSSDGFDTPEEVTASAVTKSRILFRPAKKMKALLQNLSFKKAS
tara:strand:+ start:654 stop:1154 length:501 start_codon:yes stop_codon:yes gene_type:complete